MHFQTLKIKTHQVSEDLCQSSKQKLRFMCFGLDGNIFVKRNVWVTRNSQSQWGAGGFLARHRYVASCCWAIHIFQETVAVYQGGLLKNVDEWRPFGIISARYFKCFGSVAAHDHFLDGAGLT